MKAPSNGLVEKVLKEQRKMDSLPSYRNPKDFEPCPDQFWQDVGCVDSKCPVCDAWEFAGDYPLGVYCQNLCLFPKWFVDQFNYGLLESKFRIAQEEKDMKKMEELL